MFCADPKVAQQFADAPLDFDASPYVLVAVAHDLTSLNVVDFFPATINVWQDKELEGGISLGFLERVTM